MKTIEAVLRSLETSPPIIESLAYELPEVLRKTRLNSGKWSVHEHACHLAVVGPLFETRLTLLLTENHPTITPYNPDADEDPSRLLSLDLDESLDRFKRERDHLVSRLRKLSPEQWQRSADHPEYAQYSVFTAMRHLALHDLFHGYRMEETVLSPRISSLASDLASS